MMGSAEERLRAALERQVDIACYGDPSERKRPRRLVECKLEEEGSEEEEAVAEEDVASEMEWPLNVKEEVMGLEEAEEDVASETGWPLNVKEEDDVASETEWAINFAKEEEEDAEVVATVDDYGLETKEEEAEEEDVASETEWAINAVKEEVKEEEAEAGIALQRSPTPPLEDTDLSSVVAKARPAFGSWLGLTSAAKAKPPWRAQTSQPRTAQKPRGGWMPKCQRLREALLEDDGDLAEQLATEYLAVVDNSQSPWKPRTLEMASLVESGHWAAASDTAWRLS